MKQRSRQSNKRQVALLYPAAVPWMAQFTAGVAGYAERHGGWSLLTSPPTLSGADELALNVDTLADWQGDGAIAALSRPAEARAAGWNSGSAARSAARRTITFAGCGWSGRRNCSGARRTSSCSRWPTRAAFPALPACASSSAAPPGKRP